MTQGVPPGLLSATLGADAASDLNDDTWPLGLYIGGSR